MSQKFTAPIGCEEGKLYPITETPTALTYGTPTDMSALKTYQLAVTIAEAAQYGDDVIIDNIAQITGGTITEQTAGETNEVLALINGNANDDGAATIGANDVAPALGHSLLTKVRSNATGATQEGWRAWFFYKVKYNPVGYGATGKTESVTYGVTDLTAKMLPNLDKKYATYKDFFGATAITDARTWIGTIIA
jgi:hypothetical protein